VIVLVFGFVIVILAILVRFESNNRGHHDFRERPNVPSAVGRILNQGAQCAQAAGVYKVHRDQNELRDK
jgi:hypothetical protein